MEEMMQKINIKEELVVQRHHVPLISEKEKVIVPKHFSAHPWYHGLNNDSFMYSIHNTVKDEAPSQLVEEQSADMICMFNGISSMDDLPKCDQYDDDHEAEIEVDVQRNQQHVVGRKKISYSLDMTINLHMEIMTAMINVQKISE
jgi:hypothetical protein